MSDVATRTGSNEYSHQIEFQIVERSPHLARGRMPITAGILNPFGTVHAGAMLWFADVTATVLALGDDRIGPDGKGFPLAISLNAHLLGNRRAGTLFAEARPVRRGRRVVVVRTEVKDESGTVLIDVTTSHVAA
jgi:1,4-dihydroxy-2-naphthoyl-CoA hydrolase